MDQYPFEFNVTIIAPDVESFILLLEDAGLIEQSKKCREQFEKQLNNL